MSFVGKVKHFRWHLQPLQRGKKLESLRDIQTVIKLPVDDECRRLKLRGKKMWRPFAIAFAVRPNSVSKLPFREPQLFCGTVSAFRVEHSVMRDQAFKSIGMAQNPVDHVAAVAGAQRAFTA